MRFFCFFFFLLSFFGCQQSPSLSKPLTDDQIIALLSDLHLAEAASEVDPPNKDSLFLVFEDKVLSTHQISKEDLLILMKKLESDLERYYELQKKVGERLRTLKNQEKVED